MRLTHLTLSNFRNYRRLDLQPEPGISLVHGANAQGKTNLLEAIYLLATTRPSRGGGEAELVRWHAAEDDVAAARVVGQAERREGPVTVEVAIAAKDGVSGNNGILEHASKRLKVNGVPRRSSDVIGQITSVLFTAADIDLITGPPSARRRYLDITISQTDGPYVRSLQRYARVLLQRNALLRRIDEGQARPDELGYWDEELVRDGAQITRVRHRTMQALCIAARDYHRRLSDRREDLQLSYAPQTPIPEEETPPAEEVALRLRTALQKQRRREIALGVTLVGPHRDELQFRLDGVSVASYGSRAQQRTAALALRLAETAFLTGANQDPPVLLLDDIFSELDQGRRRSVLALLGDAQQVFVTTAEPDRFEPELRGGVTVYEVHAGTLVRETAIA